MKRILHIVPQFTTGGAEKMVLYYTQMLSDCGFDVTAACAVETGELESQFTQAHLKTYICSRRLHGGRIGAYLRLLRFVRQYKPDIVHTHLFGGDLLGGLIRTIVYRRARWVTTVHNVEHQTSLIRKIVWMMLLRFADTVITVSPAVDAYAQRVFFVSDRIRRMVLNGIPLEPWQSVEPMNRLFDSSGTLQIATVGRLTKQKGHQYLFAALHMLPLDISWKLHVYGDGELRSYLESLSRQYGIDTKVIFHGVVSSLPDVLTSVSLVIQPSLWEGLSLVIMESMAAGRCIITTDAGAGGVLEHNTSGIVVPIKNPTAITDAVMSLCNDTSRAAVLAQHAQMFALSNLSMKKNVDTLVEIYHTI